MIAAVLSAAGCATTRTDTVMQTSTIDALLAGQYDGYMPCRELLKHGDHGLGTFDRLEGEMVVMDGRIYQVKADGKVYEPDPENKTPFAAVCCFRPEQTWAIDLPMSFEEVEKMIDEKAANQNMFCAIRMEGDFSYMKTRSVPMQSKPYPPLADVAKTQPQFEMENVSGTIIGFRCPPYVKGINVPGYHLHFLSDDKTRGGHILAFNMDRGTCAVDICNQFFMTLPEDDEALAGIDLSKDRSKELDDVER